MARYDVIVYSGKPNPNYFSGVIEWSKSYSSQRIAEEVANTIWTFASEKFLRVEVSQFLSADNSKVVSSFEKTFTG